MNLVEKIWKRMITYLKILFLRIRYGKQLIAPFPQRDWEHQTMLIISGKDSRIFLGVSNNFRRFLTLRALNGGSIELGCNCFCNSNVNITAMKKVKIGSNVKIANNVVIIDHDHNYRQSNTGYVSAPIQIGDNVWIGANSVILKGVTIGDHAVIAAGSVVNHDVPEHCVVAGVPARIIKEFHDEV